ncbi:MAG TPA: hypothetical protein VKU19_22420 [Bryobacteraceae bacterium]|nr:hypothetical protein [Bryobacteraceae bacterium]
MFRTLALATIVTGLSLAQETIPSQHLSEYVAKIKSSIPVRGSSAFVEPSEKDRVRFTACMKLLFEGQTAKAQTCLNSVNYNLGVLNDAGFHKEYFIATERHTGFKGLGTYIVDANYWRNVVLEAPHPWFDAETPEEALAVFQKAGGRALFIAGTHRCSDLAGASGCAGTTWACGPLSPAPHVEMPFRISDAAHFDRNFFTAAHRATLQLSPTPIAISLHGNGEEPVDAELSDGTKHAAAKTALVNRLRNALAAHGVKAGSCNWPADNPSRFLLCGGSNAQSKISNGVENCAESARTASGLFIHIEQRRNLRDDPTPMVEAVRQVFPADGPGAAGSRK